MRCGPARLVLENCFETLEEFRGVSKGGVVLALKAAIAPGLLDRSEEGTRAGHRVQNSQSVHYRCSYRRQGVLQVYWFFVW